MDDNNNLNNNFGDNTENEELRADRIPPQGEPEANGNPSPRQPEEAAYHMPQTQASFGSGDWQNGAEPGGQPQKKKGRSIWKPAAAIVLAGAICLGCGYGGFRLAYGTLKPVVIQQVTSSGSGDSGDTTGTGGTLTSQQVAAKVEPTVVAITTENMTTGNYWFGNYVTSGAGSGVIISEDGYILTAAHVITGASKITVELKDGKEYEATVVGSYVNGDIAVIKIDATGLTAATIADSDQVKQGEACYAVGNPEGRFSGSISDGIISALDRTISVQIDDNSQSSQSGNQNAYGGSLFGMFGYGQGSATRSIQLNVLQMTAAVSPGNSGGALFNANGELIGIVSAKSSDTSSEGLGFAIPSNTAMKIATELMASGTYEDPNGGSEGSGATSTTNKAVLGITATVLDESQAAQYGYTSAGVYITSITVDSTKQAGLAAGDRVISVDEVMVSQTTDITDYLADKNPGDKVTVNVERNGKMLSVSVTLVENTNK